MHLVHDMLAVKVEKCESVMMPSDMLASTKSFSDQNDFMQREHSFLLMTPEQLKEETLFLSFSREPIVCKDRKFEENVPSQRYIDLYCREYPMICPIYGSENVK